MFFNNLLKSLDHRVSEAVKLTTPGDEDECDDDVLHVNSAAKLYHDLQGLRRRHSSIYRNKQKVGQSQRIDFDFHVLNVCLKAFKNIF